MQSCDASLLLTTVRGVVSEQTSVRSFGMRNFKYVNTIKAAVEKECPLTVSCADIVALSARDGIAMVCLCHHIHMLGGESYIVRLISQTIIHLSHLIEHFFFFLSWDV
jgi:hypothetical protein